MDVSSQSEQSFSRAELEKRRHEQLRLSLHPDHDDKCSGSATSGIAQAYDDSARRLTLIIAGSGSKGNASFVYDRVSGDGILIDAGICKRDVFGACDQGGFDLKGLKGIFITHSHSDHVKNLGVILRGLRSKGIDVPIFVHECTLASSKELQLASEVNSVEFFDINKSDRIDLGSLSVALLPTSHDTEVSFGFRVDSSDDALGFITDTGVLLPQAREALLGVRILGLESNHDATMLRTGPYPRALQERVASERGHLSNDQAAEVLAQILRSPLRNRLKTVVALHISENNNTYRLPVETLRAVVEQFDADVQVTCAYQNRAVFIA